MIRDTVIRQRREGPRITSATSAAAGAGTGHDDVFDKKVQPLIRGGGSAEVVPVVCERQEII